MISYVYRLERPLRCKELFCGSRENSALEKLVTYSQDHHVCLTKMSVDVCFEVTDCKVFSSLQDLMANSIKTSTVLFAFPQKCNV